MAGDQPGGPEQPQHCAVRRAAGERQHLQPPHRRTLPTRAVSVPHCATRTWMHALFEGICSHLAACPAHYTYHSVWCNLALMHTSTHASPFFRRVIIVYFTTSIGTAQLVNAPGRPVLRSWATSCRQNSAPSSSPPMSASDTTRTPRMSPAAAHEAARGWQQHIRARMSASAAVGMHESHRWRPMIVAASADQNVLNVAEGRTTLQRFEMQRQEPGYKQQLASAFISPCSCQFMFPLLLPAQHFFGYRPLCTGRSEPATLRSHATSLMPDLSD